MTDESIYARQIAEISRFLDGRQKFPLSTKSDTFDTQ